MLFFRHTTVFRLVSPLVADLFVPIDRFLLVSVSQMFLANRSSRRVSFSRSCLWITFATWFHVSTFLATLYHTSEALFNISVLQSGFIERLNRAKALKNCSTTVDKFDSSKFFIIWKPLRRHCSCLQIWLLAEIEKSSFDSPRNASVHDSVNVAKIKSYNVRKVFSVSTFLHLLLVYIMLLCFLTGFHFDYFILLSH